MKCLSRARLGISFETNMTFGVNATYRGESIREWLDYEAVTTTSSNNVVKSELCARLTRLNEVRTRSPQLRAIYCMCQHANKRSRSYSSVWRISVIREYESEYTINGIATTDRLWPGVRDKRCRNIKTSPCTNPRTSILRRQGFNTTKELQEKIESATQDSVTKPQRKKIMLDSKFGECGLTQNKVDQKWI